MPRLPPSPFAEAERHLGRSDAKLRTLIDRVGPCTMVPNPDGFSVLVRSIVSQQISTKAAQSIGGRLLLLCGKGGFKPKNLHALTDEEIRSAGISTGKLLSLRSLSHHFTETPTLNRRLKRMTDEEVVATLLPVRGIGVWTAQMFLIFSLGRLDVLPVADLGFRAGMKHVHELPEMPDAQSIERLTETWRPYRSIGTWYIWRCRDNPEK